MTRTEHVVPSIQFLRPLRSFGEKSLKLSSPVALSPEQLMMVLGFPMDAFMRKHLGASGWKNVQNALQRKNRPTRTTRTLILRAFGTLGPAVLEAADTGKSTTLDELSTFEPFLLPLTGPRDPFVAGVARATGYVAALERLAKSWRPASPEGSPSNEWKRLEDFGIRALSAWNEVLPMSEPRAHFALDATLHALAEFDAGVGAFLGRPSDSCVATLLDHGAQPLTHWMRRVHRAYRVANNRKLDSLLWRRGVRHTTSGAGTRITHDTLRKWAIGGQLAKTDAVKALLSALPAEQRQSIDRLEFDYRMARALTFLIQAVAALSAPQLQERQAQSLVRERYLALFRQAAGSC